MDLNITPDLYSNFSEIYVIGSQCVEVNTKDNRTVRIAAQKVLRGPSAIYTATYSQLKDFDLNGQTLRVWSQAHYPFAHGNTIENCIRAGMSFVNNQKC